LRWSPNIQQKAIIDELGLNLNRRTRKGWCICDCPYCGKKAKFGVRFNDDPKYAQWTNKSHKNKVSFNCWAKNNCGESGATGKLLKLFKLDHLIGNKDFIDDNFEKIELSPKDDVVDIDIKTPTQRPPIGFKRVYSNEYLENRKFEPWQFKLYHIGISNLLGMKGRVIFLIEEDGENKGYVARDTTGKSIMKYKNQSVDFEKLLMGIDEVGPEDDVIIVEGVTDKGEVDRKIKRLGLDNIKCVCTFGKKISEIQLTKLANRGIESVIFMYDDDAINESKTYSIFAENYINKVKVCFINEGDPDELSDEDFLEVLSGAKTPMDFDLNIVNIRKLV